MHGIIHLELEKFVVQNFGRDAWEKIVERAGLTDRLYTPMQAYPDQDVVKVVEVAVAMTKKPANEILEAFGEFLVPTYCPCTDRSSIRSGERSTSFSTPRRRFTASFACGSRAPRRRVCAWIARRPTRSRSITTRRAASARSPAGSCAASRSTSARTVDLRKSVHAPRRRRVRDRRQIRSMTVAMP